MADALPSVTVIIPTRPGQSQVLAVQVSRAQDYPRDKLEMIVARGRHPAVQRNHALKAARGELIYFLDDDSAPLSDNLRRAAKHFQDPAVKVVGGPNLCPAEAPLLERVFAVVLASWLAFGPSRARYASVGSLHETTEKELILCNLAARRSDILELGGFDEALYPNEENALMDELQKGGGKLLYDPEFIVHRRPRPTLKAFAKMLLNYGRGRAEQFRLHPTLGSALNFVPPLFLLFLLALPLLGRPGLAMMGLYASAVLVQTLVSMMGGKGLLSLLAMPLLTMTHMCYGLGFWRGLLTFKRKTGAEPKEEVFLEKIPV